MSHNDSSRSEVSTPADRVVAPAPPPGPVYLRPEHLYKAAGLLFLFALFYRFFDAVAQTLLILYAAAILAVLLNTVVRAFPVQRKWVSAVLGVVLIGALGALLWFGLPALLGQLRNISGEAPALQAQLQNAETWLRENTGLNIQLVGPQMQEMVRNAFGGRTGGELMGRAQSLIGVLFVPLLILFGGLFAVAKPNDRLLSPALRSVPRDMRLAFRRMLELLGVRIVGWLQGTLIGMIAVGVLSFVLYSLIGVPNALLISVINALLEFIPLLGPWVGGGIAVAVAFLDDPSKALWAALAALAIQQIENNLILPFAMAKAADLHPLVTLFALVLFGSLFGFLGILLAIPLVLLFWTVIEVLWVERAIDTDEDPIAPVVKE